MFWSRTGWSLCLFWIPYDYSGCLYYFSKNVWQSWNRAQNMLYFGLWCSSSLMDFISWRSFFTNFKLPWFCRQLILWFQKIYCYFSMLKSLLLLGLNFALCFSPKFTHKKKLKWTSPGGHSPRKVVQYRYVRQLRPPFHTFHAIL